MNVLISAHFDLSHPVMSIKMDDKKIDGLVDNFAGVFTAYQVSRKTGIPVYFTNFEELEFDGAIDVAKSLPKDDTLVIVIDTILEDDANGKKAVIANTYGISVEPLKEKLQEHVHFINGFFEEEEDETWIYGHEFGLKTFYFGIPIPNDYHDVNNNVALQVIDEATEILLQIISNLNNS